MIRWVCVLLCLFALGAQPVARIAGIDETSIIEPGDPLEFEADSLTEKERCKWSVVPAFSQTGKPTHKVSADRKTLVLFSRAGVYSVTLFVWNEEDLAQTSRIINVGGKGPPPKPDPKPDPIPEPEPKPTPLGLVPVVKAAVRSVPAAERPVAKLIADAYRDGAKKIVEGTWSVETAMAKQRDVNRAIAGYKPESWSPVFRDIADMLADAKMAGKFATKRDYVAVWAELSLAFSGAAE